MLKKTKIITKTYLIVDSTYSVLYPDRCTSCNMSIDRPSRATLDNWKGGGEYTKKQIYYTIFSAFLPCQKTNLPGAKCTFYLFFI